MSKFENQVFRYWEAVEESLRRIRPQHKGKALSKRDGETYKSAIFLQGLMLEDLLIDRIPDRQSRIIRWITTMCNTDLDNLAKGLKVLTSYFRHYCDGEERVSYECFKHTHRLDFPEVGIFLSPIKEEVESFLLDPQWSAFAVINQHISFIARLSLRDVDYTSQCLTEYIELENSLASHVYDPVLLSSLNSIMKEWLLGLDFSDFVPNHGPGAVAGLGRVSLETKYRNIGYDNRIRYFCNKWDLAYEDYLPSGNQPFDRTCEVIFVPKSIQTFRTISMEPASLMYFQQGCWSVLDRFMKASKVLSRIMRLDDQTINKNLARESSYRRDYATIDLSAASDCVTWELAKAVFRGTALERVIYASRSTHALLPDGEKIALTKFAPMGSALCFPIECLVFAAICEHVVRTRGRSSKAMPYSVYGDDIVIRSSYAHKLCETLIDAGFRPNASKSFLSPRNPFRESCGGEYFDGMDVTPFRLSRKFSSEKPSVYHPKSWDAYVDGANRAYTYGFRLVRRWFLNHLLKFPQHLRPMFGQDIVRTLFSESPTNFHLKEVYLRDWQCYAWKHGITVSKDVSPDDQDPSIRYYEWLRQTRNRSRSFLSPDDLLPVKICSSSLALETSLTPNSRCVDLG